MNINFTVVVQLVHFFIAYILIERFLLRPACALIKQEDDQQLKLQNLAAFNQERLEHMTLDAEREWRMMQKLFYSTMPKPQLVDSRTKTPLQIEPEPLNTKKVDEVIQKSTNLLFSRLAHD